MSDFSCNIFKVPTLQKHDNADSLSIIEFEGQPVIIRTTDFKDGDLGIYIPVEALIPEGKAWVIKHCSHLKFKNGVHRVKAVRLRGVFSMGMVVPYQALVDELDSKGETFSIFWGTPESNISKDVSTQLGIIKFEEPEDIVHTPKEKKPKTLWGKIKHFFYGLFRKKQVVVPRVMPVYEVDHYRKLKDVLVPGEEVIVTEKVHGTNAAYCWHNDRFYVSSHHVVRGVEDNSAYWRAARQYDLENKLKAYPELAFFGEIYGPSIQDMGYGLKNDDIKLSFFDVMQIKDRKYFNYDDACKILDELELPRVPLIYSGPYLPEVVEPLVEGKSLVECASHNREGFVISPREERISYKCGRIKLKMISEWYLTRKGGSEFH